MKLAKLASKSSNAFSEVIPSTNMPFLLVVNLFGSDRTIRAYEVGSIRVIDMINTTPGSRVEFDCNYTQKKQYNNRSNLELYSSSRAKNEAFWISTPLSILGPLRTPEPPYKVKIDQQSDGAHRSECLLNLAINRVASDPVVVFELKWYYHVQEKC